jgi:hypothetical protein
MPDGAGAILGLLTMASTTTGSVRPLVLPSTLSLVGNAGINPGIEHVKHQGGQTQRHDYREDNALDEKVVVLLPGSQTGLASYWEKRL